MHEKREILKSAVGESQGGRAEQLHREDSMSDKRDDGRLGKSDTHNRDGRTGAYGG